MPIFNIVSTIAFFYVNFKLFRNLRNNGFSLFFLIFEHEHEQSKEYDSCSADTDPREPRHPLGDSVVEIITGIAYAISVGVELVMIGGIRAVIICIQDAIMIIIFAGVTEPASVWIFLIWIRNIYTIIDQIRYAVPIRVSWDK